MHVRLFKETNCSPLSLTKAPQPQHCPNSSNKQLWVATEQFFYKPD